MDALRILRRALQRRGQIATSDLVDSGLSRATLFRALKQLMQEGEIVRLRRGVYARADDVSEADGWTLALHQHPRGVLCLLTALLFHRITTQAPAAVWLALPKGARPPAAGYPVIRAVYLSGASFTEGVERHAGPGGEIRVYSVAKTVADCFKFRHRIGLDVALEALREGWRERRFTLDELHLMAQACRVQAVMRPYVEALVA